jgi:hypothetical protein
MRAPNRFKESSGAGFAHLFFYLFDAAQFDAGIAAGCFRAHPLRNFFFGEQAEVEIHFLIKLLLVLLTMRQVAKHAGNARE